MAKQEFSVSEAKAAVEMMKMAQPENAQEASLQKSLLAKMIQIIKEDEAAKQKVAEEAGKKKVNMLAKAINECLEKYHAELVLSSDELGVPVLAVYDEDTGVTTLL